MPGVEKIKIIKILFTRKAPGKIPYQFTRTRVAKVAQILAVAPPAPVACGITKSKTGFSGFYSFSAPVRHKKFVDIWPFLYPLLRE